MQGVPIFVAVAHLLLQSFLGDEIVHPFRIIQDIEDLERDIHSIKMGHDDMLILEIALHDRERKTGEIEEKFSFLCEDLVDMLDEVDRERESFVRVIIYAFHSWNIGRIGSDDIKAFPGEICFPVAEVECESRVSIMVLEVRKGIWIDIIEHDLLEIWILLSHIFSDKSWSAAFFDHRRRIAEVDIFQGLAEEECVDGW